MSETAREMLGERLDEVDAAVRAYLDADGEMDLRRAERAVAVAAVKLSAVRAVLGEEPLS